MSEKRRRDQFNNLINEMCTMVSKNKKMDKTTVLKTAIAVIKSQKGKKLVAFSKLHLTYWCRLVLSVIVFVS